MLIIRLILTYTIIFLAGMLSVVPCLIVASLPEKWRYRNRIYYAVSYFFYRACVAAAWVPINIEYESEEVLNKPSIVISNHQSSFDIPLIGLIVKQHPHVWLFLARYAKIPIFGYILSRMNITVDYKSVRKLVGALDETLDVISKCEKSHVVIFPEGGRYIDGKVHKFMQGFAALAKKTGRPVVPIFLQDVYKVFPPGALMPRWHPIRIVVGKPFTIKEGEPDESFVSRVYQWYKQQEES